MVSKSAISRLYRYSIPRCLTFYIISSTLSIVNAFAYALRCIISFFVLIRRNCVFSSSDISSSSSTSSYLCILLASNLSCETTFSCYSISTSPGSSSISPACKILLRMVCLSVALSSGLRIPAQGMCFPFPICLKSSRMTPLGLVLTRLIIYCTYSALNSSPMHLRMNMMS